MSRRSRTIKREAVYYFFKLLLYLGDNYRPDGLPAISLFKELNFPRAKRGTFLVIFRNMPMNWKEFMYIDKVQSPVDLRYHKHIKLTPKGLVLYSTLKQLGFEFVENDEEAEKLAKSILEGQGSGQSQ